jgi:tetratricopeptide (TPR) repeat protein
MLYLHLNDDLKMKRFLIIITLIASVAVVLPSCTKQVSFNTYRPAAINVPSHVKTLVVIDRTAFKDQRVNIIEGILTGEGIGEDRNATEEAIISFRDKLLTSPRFEVKRGSERLFGNSIIGTFPEPLTWHEISSLCVKYQADALVTIEVFDTNFLVTDGKRNVKKTIEKDGRKKEVEVVEYFAEGVASCKIGFRIYDPKSKSIADQQMFNKSNTWEAKGSSIKEALSLLIQKSEATKYTSRLAGNSYAEKIAPMPIRISRTFYAKPKKNQYMASGVRMAEVSQWEEAIDTWKQGISFTSTKTAGKISYNIAVAYEVLGDFNSAKDWANKAYINYGNKKARDYNAMLNNRIRNEAIVKQQLQ